MNADALAFYKSRGFESLFIDRGARRYDTSGFLLQNVLTSKITMRKVRLHAAKEKTISSTLSADMVPWNVVWCEIAATDSTPLP